MRRVTGYYMTLAPGSRVWISAREVRHSHAVLEAINSGSGYHDSYLCKHEVKLLFNMCEQCIKEHTYE